MFLSKVNDQKLELLRAVFRNMYLKEKCDYLDSECKMLAEQLISTQVVKAEKSETIMTMKKELNSLKQLNEHKMQELAITNEKIVSMAMLIEDTKSTMSSSLDQYKSINEELQFKDEMIKCLQEELVQVRLNEAEKWAIIKSLKETKNELEKENGLLVTRKPETISRLQEELISSRLLERQYSLEFENIKKQLAQIKEQTKVCKSKNLSEKKEEGSIELRKNKGAFWRSNYFKNDEINELLSNIENLNKEKVCLESRILELQKKIDVLNKHLQFKDEQRRKLQEKLDKIKIKHQSTKSVTSERIRQIDHLEKTATNKVFEIRNSSDEKRQNIEELSSKLQELSELSIILQPGEITELTTIQSLEQQVSVLQERIEQLNSEIRSDFIT